VSKKHHHRGHGYSSNPQPMPPNPVAGQPAQPAPSMPVPTGPVPSLASQAADKPRIDQLIQALEQARGRRAIIYWLPPVARIADAVVMPLHDQITAIGRQDRLDLVLFTVGGDTEVPWRIISLLREYCTHLGVVVPYRCHSAGTVVAMGANEIVMTPMSVLGPIDPSRTHPLLPRREGASEAEPISVQDMRHAMQFIREAAGPGQTAYTPEAMAQIFTALFDKIHPLAIGAIEQSYALAKIVGKQCLSTHMDPVTQADAIKGIVDKLCDEYKSHAYQISRQEARAIGLKVVDAPPNVEAAMMDLLKFYTARPVFPSKMPSKGQSFKAYMGWLESTALHMIIEGELQVQADGTVKPLGDKWVVY
jgi:serine dehydrogenase proteinase